MVGMFHKDLVEGQATIFIFGHKLNIITGISERQTHTNVIRSHKGLQILTILMYSLKSVTLYMLIKHL